MKKKERFRWSYRRSHWRGVNGMCVGGYIGHCMYCGREKLLTYAGNWCVECRRKIHDASYAVKQRAHYEVARAKRRGEIAALDGSVVCVDCGRPAAAYDHRDYSRPLDVEPVCKRCNILRGMAIQTAALRAQRINGGDRDAISKP